MSIDCPGLSGADSNIDQLAQFQVELSVSKIDLNTYALSARPAHNLSQPKPQIFLRNGQLITCASPSISLVKFAGILGRHGCIAQHDS